MVPPQQGLGFHTATTSHFNHRRFNNAISPPSLDRSAVNVYRDRARDLMARILSGGAAASKARRGFELARSAGFHPGVLWLESSGNAARGQFDVAGALEASAASMQHACSARGEVVLPPMHDRSRGDHNPEREEWTSALLADPDEGLTVSYGPKLDSGRRSTSSHAQQEGSGERRLIHRHERRYRRARAVLSWAGSDRGV